MAITSNPVKYNAVVVGQGTSNRLNITAATVVKPTAGRVAKVSVIAASTAGSQNAAVADATVTTGITDANLVAVIPDVIGTYNIDMPVTHGLVIIPGGAGQVLAVSYA